jgi:UPF0755 protein
MKRIHITGIILVVVTVLLSSFTFYFYQVFFSANFLTEDSEDRFFNIPTGSTFADVQWSIYEQRLVQDALSFSFVARLLKYDRLVKPGRFRIHPGASNLEIVRMLRAGEQEPVRIAFNNVRTLNELPEKLSANIELGEEELAAWILHDSTARHYGFSPETFLCMFIPNTYEVYWNIGAKRLLDRFRREYDQFWNAERRAKAQDLGLSTVEAGTLASIVQAECSHYEEAPIVAGLYLNRLKRGILLQADPTLVYAVGDFEIKRVLNVHKAVDSPYNTYRYAGLPPGPINCPEPVFIEAVLNPVQHDYLYMCARDDFSGYHHFSRTLAEHGQYARRYQQALNRARLYK